MVDITVLVVIQAMAGIRDIQARVWIIITISVVEVQADMEVQVDMAEVKDTEEVMVEAQAMEEVMAATVMAVAMVEVMVVMAVEAGPSTTIRTTIIPRTSIRVPSSRTVLTGCTLLVNVTPTNPTWIRRDTI